MKELKPNFTQVPNVLLDEFMSQVDSDTFKVLMVICRKIYGYHKDSDRISLSQLQNISGLSRKMVKKAIRILIERKVLYILENETRTHARRYTLILSENSTWIPQEPSVDPVGTLRGSHRDPQEDPTETLQNKKKENKQNIFLNKEAEYQKNKVSEIAVKEYIVNNSVGGVKITGEHYFYLNFCQISLKITKKITDATELINKKTKVETAVTFPDFWDSDWYYFNECKRAEDLGLHMIVLKPRRRGYSYKNAAKCAWTYTFSNQQSNSLILAEDKKYSEETMRMAVSYLDFLNRYTGFSRQRQHINKPREIVQASYEETTPDGRKLIGGSMSRIMQYSTLNNPDVARGKDARVILFEECFE